MRMIPSRYSQPKPAKVKAGAIARIKHLGAPLKGLSLSSKLVAGDPLTAPILDNWVIEENQIKCRAGTRLVVTYAAGQPVWCLIPFYGGPNKLAAATNHEIRLLDNTLVKGGFTSDDWHWTSFSNLGQQDFTVMVNGADGVWSWIGSAVPAGPAVNVVSISKANPAVVTVAAADIGHFVGGMNVTIAGATGDFAVCNGTHVIARVGTPANTFSLMSINTSAATGVSNVGITATGQGSMVKETVTAPASAHHIVPDQFQLVVSHMNRLWFADNSNLSVYYLPLQQKSGEVKELPLNAVFKRGGSIRALATWTVDGGMGLDDQIVIFSSNGEAAIYGGTDPDSDFTLTGVYSFDSPMGKHCVVNYGGELYVLISSGLVPMTTLMKAESEQLGQYDRSVYSEFFGNSLNYRDRPGWSVMLNHSSGRLFCNMPLGGANSYRQMVRFMPNPIWVSWSGLPMRCMNWVNNQVFFGSDDGRVYECHPNYLNDADPQGNPKPIKVDVQAAWSDYGTPLSKHFKMIRPYIISDGRPQPYVDMRVDYDMAPPQNQPDVTAGDPGALWDVAIWAKTQDDPPDGSYWATAQRSHNNWTGVGVIGAGGCGPRLTASIINCSFALSGWDVVYEQGSAIG